MSPRLRKYAKLLQNPACWPVLAQGVAATLDHDAALGRDRFATVVDVGANKGQFAVYARPPALAPGAVDLFRATPRAQGQARPRHPGSR